MSKKQLQSFIAKISEKSPKKAKKVVIACSGWPDSMVLLDLYVTGILPSSEIVVAHINHHLRESAQRDEDIVRSYCAKKWLICEVFDADVGKEAKKTKTTLEECARNIRKTWLEKIRKKYHADSIVTAHHADDQAETILYRITKWTALTGLVGIEELSGNYVRPLLQVTKNELINYAQEHKIRYGYDETNDDTNIPRNLLRHEVLEDLRKINPEVNTALSRLSHSAQELKMSFDAFFTEVRDNGFFELDWYHSLPLGFQHELLRFLYEKANNSTHGLSTSLIQELDRFLSTRNGGKKEIKKLTLQKKQGKVFIGK
jgi:tRNA(Ile)-lysidine synthetase-like protein